MIPGEDLEFHHVGHVVHSIEASVGALSVLGYDTRSPVYPDPRQGIRICFVTAGSGAPPRIELVEPVGEDSVVRGLLTKQGAGPYHLCFGARNLVGEMEHLEGLGYRRLAEPFASPAFEGRAFVFLYHKDAGLIELVDQGG